MPGTASEAAANATAAIGKHNIPNMCLYYVRTWCGAPGGYPNAGTAWLAAKYKHGQDRNPPAGVPVFFMPNHVALSIGGQNIVSTDWPHAGVIGQTTIDELEKAWHKTYYGWTEDIDKMRIQGIGPHSAPKGPTVSGGTAIPNPVDIYNMVKDIYNALSQVGQAFAWLTNAQNILRVYAFVIGAVLIFVALVGAERATETVKSVGKVAANAASA